MKKTLAVLLCCIVSCSSGDESSKGLGQELGACYVDQVSSTPADVMVYCSVNPVNAKGEVRDSPFDTIGPCRVWPVSSTSSSDEYSVLRSFGKVTVSSSSDAAELTVNNGYYNGYSGNTLFAKPGASVRFKSTGGDFASFSQSLTMPPVIQLKTDITANENMLKPGGSWSVLWIPQDGTLVDLQLWIVTQQANGVGRATKQISCVFDSDDASGEIPADLISRFKDYEMVGVVDVRNEARVPLASGGVVSLWVSQRPLMSNNVDFEPDVAALVSMARAGN